MFQIGVVFYNTLHSPDSQTGDHHIVVPPNTAILLPMQIIAKSSISYIKNMRASSDFHDFANRYGSTSAASSFCEALWLCSRMLVNADYKLQTSTIVVFTNNEQPHAEGSAELQKTFVRARDLHAMNVDLMVVPMVDVFDDTKFYRELICTVSDVDADDYRRIDPIEQRVNLCRRIFRRDMKRSCLRYFNWTLGDGLEIGCGLHSFTKSSMKPRSVHLLAATNELVESKRVYKTHDDETDADRRLLPGELRKFQSVGGRRVVLTPEELATAKTIMAPGMKLLGFKPLTQLQPRWFVKPSRLLYPSDSHVKGSTQLFRVVWERCLAKQCFAVCVFVQIRKVEPRYVALVPQTEEHDGSDGFRIVYLPMQSECVDGVGFCLFCFKNYIIYFIDEADIRCLDIFDRTLPELTDDATKQMIRLVKKLKFKYDPTIFRDPHLEVSSRFQSYILRFDFLYLQTSDLIGVLCRLGGAGLRGGAGRLRGCHNAARRRAGRSHWRLCGGADANVWRGTWCILFETFPFILICRCTMLQDCAVSKRPATSKLASQSTAKKSKGDTVLSQDDVCAAISCGAVSSHILV